MVPGELEDAAVCAVGDIHVSAGIDRHAARVHDASAEQHLVTAIGGDFGDAGYAGVGDVHVTGGVHGEATGRSESCAKGG